MLNTQLKITLVLILFSTASFSFAAEDQAPSWFDRVDQVQRYMRGIEAPEWRKRQLDREKRIEKLQQHERALSRMNDATKALLDSVSDNHDPEYKAQMEKVTAEMIENYAPVLMGSIGDFMCRIPENELSGLGQVAEFNFRKDKLPGDKDYILTPSVNEGKMNVELPKNSFVDNTDGISFSYDAKKDSISVNPPMVIGKPFLSEFEFSLSDSRIPSYFADFLRQSVQQPLAFRKQLCAPHSPPPPLAPAEVKIVKTNDGRISLSPMSLEPMTPSATFANMERNNAVPELPPSAFAQDTQLARKELSTPPAITEKIAVPNLTRPDPLLASEKAPKTSHSTTGNNGVTSRPAAPAAPSSFHWEKRSVRRCIPSNFSNRCGTYQNVEEWVKVYHQAPQSCGDRACASTNAQTSQPVDHGTIIIGEHYSWRPESGKTYRICQTRALNNCKTWMRLNDQWVVPSGN